MKVSTKRPVLIAFLIDRSGSMGTRDPESGLRLSEIAAKSVNRAMYEIALQACIGGGDIRDRVHISAYGYGDKRSPDQVRWALDGLPESRGWVGAQKWVSSYQEIESEIVGYDGPRAITMETPQWVAPKHDGRTMMANAFRRVGRIVASHMREHPESAPPIVVNITDGHPYRGNWKELQDAACEIVGRFGGNGPPVLLNIHLDPSADALILPADEPDEDGDKYACNMFRVSSPIPEWMVQNARENGLEIEAGARGLVVNASEELLHKFLSVGTGIARISS